MSAFFFPDPCFYNGTCSNTDGSYKCSCTSVTTGKTCELDKAACDGNPCNGTDTCVLSDRSSRGFQCVNKQLETVMILPEGRSYGSVFDLEKEIENLIKSAPNNAKKVRWTFYKPYIHTYIIDHSALEFPRGGQFTISIQLINSFLCFTFLTDAATLYTPTLTGGVSRM